MCQKVLCWVLALKTESVLGKAMIWVKTRPFTTVTLLGDKLDVGTA